MVTSIRVLTHYLCQVAAPMCIALIAVSSAGCADGPHLRPAAGAHRLAQNPNSATSVGAGVRLTAEADAWQGHPPTFGDTLVPMRITLENASDHPLRVRYAEFRLRGPALDYQPLPPRKLVDRSVTVKKDPLLVPRFVSEKFHVAPFLYPNFPGLDVSDLPWENSPEFYTRQYAKWTVDLPTVDMIDQALPEGVLDPGGRLQGFLYFEPVPKHTHEVSLHFDLVDAKSHLSYGRIDIPFTVH